MCCANNNHAVIPLTEGVTGAKRSRDETDETDKKQEDSEDKKRPDPTEIPDPQVIPDWSDEEIQELCKELFTVTDTSEGAVTLDPCNCDLDFMIREDGLGGSPLTMGGFAHLLSGCKATYGIKKGQYFFECKVSAVLVTYTYM